MIQGKHFISGKWCPSGSKNVTLNPSTGEKHCSYDNATSEVIDRAVSESAQAQTKWSELGVKERSKHLMSLVNLLREGYGDEGEKSELKSTIMDEIGKPLPEADIEVLECADFIEFFATNGPSALIPRKIKINAEVWPTKSSSLVRKPVGTVLLIKPWNYPMEMIAWSMGAALIAGNSVVIKSSEKSPVSTMKLVEMVAKSSIPDGVVNMVLGDASVGKQLIAHPKTNMVSFTGSVSAGRSVASEAGKLLKKCVLELGGNDAAIVLKDANPKLAANGLVWGAFCNAGQVCVGVKRAYVHESIYDEVKQFILDKSKELRAGTDFGPLIDNVQLERFQRFIINAKEVGNEVLLGGEPLKEGTFFEPTVIEVNNDRAFLFDEECFGPLLPLIKYVNLEETINLINESQYGLGASIWSANVKNAKTLAKKLNVGMVWVNDVNVAFPEAPWGGVKASGIGSELSVDAILEYTTALHISVESSDDETRFWWYPY